MKKFALIFLLISASVSVYAQDGFTFLGLRSGWVMDKGFSTTLNLDFSSLYYSSYELYGEYYVNDDFDYNSVMGGVVYKALVIRNRNFIFKMRLGGGIGIGKSNARETRPIDLELSKFIFSTTDIIVPQLNPYVFLIAPQIGWEVSQSVYRNIDIVLVNRNQYVFFDEQPNRWRVGIELGLRLPL